MLMNHLTLTNPPIIKVGIKVGAALCLTVALSCLTGCQKNSQQRQHDNQPPKSQQNDVSLHKPIIFATTNVWGSVAQAIGSDKVDVKIGVNDLSQDPHDYQATANDKLNVNNSTVVLVNGGGYDDWGTSLAESVASKPAIVNAVDLSRLQPTAQIAHPNDFNEHVFFSLDTAKKVAQAVKNQLTLSDPSNQAVYTQNATNFSQEIDRLKTKAHRVGQNKQITAFVTEPVVGYLLADMGIKDVTPNGYIEQSETDAGVSVKLLNDSKKLLTNHQANVLIVNAQTENSTSKQLVALANQLRIPVISVYETFPQGITTYPQFIDKTIDDFAKIAK